MKQIIKALSVLLIGLWLVNCNDPTTIGSDLLDGDQLNLDFTDTITLVGNVTDNADSLVTYSRSQGYRLSSYLVGILDDDVFGRSESTIYANPYLRNNEVPKFARGDFFPSAQVDSIILVLPWDSVGIYGDTLDELFSIEVYELLEHMDPEETYYSDQVFDYDESAPIAKLENFLARPTTRTTTIEPTEDATVFDTSVTQAQLRIPFENDFVERFFPQMIEDTLNFQNDTLFLNFFNGLHVKAGASTSTKAMLSFDLEWSTGGIWVYYRTSDGPAVYQFPIFLESARMTNFSHDHSTGTINTFLENPDSEEDSILFVQGMGGVSTVIEIPYAESWENIIVNKAELEIPVIQIPGDNPLFTPPDQLAVEEILEDGSTRLIADFGIALTLGNSFTLAFGGDIINGEKYLINMSSQFQDMIVGGVSKKIKVTVLNRQNRVSRAVFAGSQNSETPFRLNLSYTNIE